MADYHEIVDQIRGFVQSSDQTRNERLEGWASGYAAACVEVNQRLGRCQRLLQQGLRSEAIQLAETQPKLLEAVTVLDFQERAEWDEIVGIYGLAAAPTLLVEAARFLNEAYAQEEPLQDLLRTHRRMSMQRAPLRLRIGVIRKLAAQDPNNLIWGDDLRSFEKARFKQIPLETAEALRLNDPTHVGRLLAEVQDQSWIEPPPNALAQGLTKADARLRGQQTRAALAELEAQLSDAFTSRDPIRGRIARKEWIRLTKNAARESSDPIRERVQPALDWLEDDDRRVQADQNFEKALGKLVRVLDAPGSYPPSELERRGTKLLSFGRGMPEALQQRYLSRLQVVEAARALRFRLLIAGTAAGILLAASLVFYAVRSSIRSGDASRAATAVTDMLELGELDQAGAFLEALEKKDAGLLSYVALFEARQNYQGARDKENDRALKFDEAIREAEQAPLARTEPKALDRARSLARRETEKKSIARVVERRQAAILAERETHETTLRPRLDAISREVYRIGQSLEAIPLDQAQVMEAIAKSQRALTDLTPHLTAAGDELQGLARALGGKLETVRNRLGQIQRQAHALEEITAAVAYSPAGSPIGLGPFASRLQEYLKAYPGDSHALAFKDALNEQPLWNAIEGWNRLVGDWKSHRGELPPQEARLRIKQCDQFLTQHPAFPGREGVTRYQKYAEAIARRAPGADSPATKLQSLLADILVDHVWMVRVGAKDADEWSIKRYYTTKQPVEEAGFVKFGSIVAHAGKEQPRAISRDRVDYLGLSPQSKISARFKPILEDPTSLNRWESVMIDLVNAIIGQPDIDPILQVGLLRKVIDSAIEGSDLLQEPLANIKNRLDRARVDVNALWMDPEGPQPDRSRSEARELVQALRGSMVTPQQISTRRDQIEKGFAQVYRPVGWLALDPAGWQVRSGPTNPDQGDLWVVVRRVAGHGEWRKLGTIVGGKPTIDTRDGSALAEGRPVFVIMSS
jgi:hypothetical protein